MTIGPSFRIYPAQGVAHLTWGALTTFELWRTLLGDATRDSRFQRGYSILEDLRQLRTPDTLVREWAPIVEEFAPRVSPCRWAVVLPPVTLSVFDQVRAAADWLRRDGGVDLCVFLDFKAATYWASRSEKIRRSNPDQPDS